MYTRHESVASVCCGSACLDFFTTAVCGRLDSSGVNWYGFLFLIRGLLLDTCMTETHSRLFRLAISQAIPSAAQFVQGLPDNTNEHRIFRDLQALQATAARWGFESGQAVGESPAGWNMTHEKERKYLGTKYSLSAAGLKECYIKCLSL